MGQHCCTATADCELTTDETRALQIMLYERAREKDPVLRAQYRREFYEQFLRNQRALHRGTTNIEVHRIRQKVQTFMKEHRQRSASDDKMDPCRRIDGDSNSSNVTPNPLKRPSVSDFSLKAASPAAANSSVMAGDGFRREALESIPLIPTVPLAHGQPMNSQNSSFRMSMSGSVGSYDATEPAMMRRKRFEVLALGASVARPQGSENASNRSASRRIRSPQLMGDGMMLMPQASDDPSTPRSTMETSFTPHEHLERVA